MYILYMYNCVCATVLYTCMCMFIWRYTVTTSIWQSTVLYDYHVQDKFLWSDKYSLSLFEMRPTDQIQSNMSHYLTSLRSNALK